MRGEELSVLGDFRTFISKGNVIDLAVAVVIGVAFNSMVQAFVADVITPLIGIAGKIDLSSYFFTVNGSTFLVGTFLNTVISFIILALVVFFLIVRPIAKMKERQEARKPKAEPNTKECPYCLSMVPKKATKCMYCTSRLK